MLYVDVVLLIAVFKVRDNYGIAGFTNDTSVVNKELSRFLVKSLVRLYIALSKLFTGETYTMFYFEASFKPPIFSFVNNVRQRRLLQVLCSGLLHALSALAILLEVISV